MKQMANPTEPLGIVAGLTGKTREKRVTWRAKELDAREASSSCVSPYDDVLEGSGRSTGSELRVELRRAGLARSGEIRSPDRPLRPHFWLLLTAEGRAPVVISGSDAALEDALFELYEEAKRSALGDEADALKPYQSLVDQL